MAHLYDSNIQAHSAGPMFPYVIYRREIDGVKYWGVEGPRSTKHLFRSYEQAQAFVLFLKENKLAA